MNSNVIYVLVWILAGMVIMGLIVWFTMPLLMMVKLKSKLNYDDTIRVFGEAIVKKQDWKVLVVNDYQKSTEAFTKLEKVCSINICNPRYASMILSNDKNRFVTAIMPLAVGVHEEKNGQVSVSLLNVGLLGKMFGGTISKVMGTAGKEINEAVNSVKAD